MVLRFIFFDKLTSRHGIIMFRKYIDVNIEPVVAQYFINTRS